MIRVIIMYSIFTRQSQMGQGNDFRIRIFLIEKQRDYRLFFKLTKWGGGQKVF